MTDNQEWGDLSGLRMLAEGLTDAKQNRIRTVNRIERGGTADRLHGELIIAHAVNQEEEYGRQLVAEYEAVVPARVRDWAANIPGLGKGELFPRILGGIGHPVIATPEKWDGPKIVPAGPPYERMVSQLWQYCGCGDPARVPKKNATREDLLAAGKRRTVRPLLYTFSSGLVRAHTRSEAVAKSRFWGVYTGAREGAAGHAGTCDAGTWPGSCSETHKRHGNTCKNRKIPPMSPNGCATVARPEWGEPGSPWRPGHINMHAHRMVHKELLRQLWEISH